MDKLSVCGIEKYLKNKEKFDISVFESVDSTNAILKNSAQNGEKEGTIIIADSQTNGRGRFVRKFHSPSGSGIYMSILLKPDLPAENAVLITAAAAAAVSRAVENLSQKNTHIKWVNDILIDNKKICGILTEGGINTKTGGFDWVVVGIGINAYEPDGGFEDEISHIAGAVFKEKTPDLRNRLTAEIINCFWDFYKHLEQRTFFNDYKNRMMVIGKEITVIKGGTKTFAKCLDLDSNCQLLVDYGESREYLSSGEISIKLNG